MIYICINGLLIEAESTVEFHVKTEFSRKGVVYRREPMSSVSEDDTITEIVREVLKQMME